MKVKFSKVVDFTPKWNGNLDLPENERITAQISAMRFGDLMITLASMPKNITGETPTDAQNVDNVKSISAMAAELLPKYVKVSGLEDDDGVVTIDVIASYAEYSGLSTELFMQLLAISSPKENDEKN